MSAVAATGHVRPLRPGDAPAVRALFADTAAAGAPLRLPAGDLDAYADLCLGWYLEEDGSACAVLVDPEHGDDEIVGYAMVALDHTAYERWARRRAAAWLGRAALRAAMAPRGRAAAFTARRLVDGVVTTARGPRPPMPAHFHFNVREGRRGVRAGFQLAGHADRVVAAAGLPGYFGEVNVRRARPGRARALERLGARVVHRQPNATLSWLAGEPVDRLTVRRSLDPADGWTPLT